jgi:hypothetical protein
MIEYKNDLRMRVCARKGTAEEPDLNPTPGFESPLDKEIIACAGKHVKGQQLRAFFWAYHCANSWEEVQMKFHRHLKSELDMATVQRYARDAANRIVERIARG